MLFKQEKTNQFDQAELGAYILNMHCAICPLGAVAFNFLKGWSLDLEYSPSLATGQE